MPQGSNTLFHCPIGPLRLAIRLRMVGTREVQLRTHYGPQTLPKISSEPGVPVRNNPTRETMVTNNNIKKDLCHTWGTQLPFPHSERSEFNKIRKLVHAGKHSVKAISAWEVSDEIDRPYIKRSLRRRQRLQQTLGRLIDVLSPLAHSAAPHKTRNIRSHAWPPNTVCQRSGCLPGSQVSSILATVHLLEQLLP